MKRMKRLILAGVLVCLTGGLAAAQGVNMAPSQAEDGSAAIGGTAEAPPSAAVAGVAEVVEQQQLAWTHALSMHGDPALAPGGGHLAYADPEAPRGGTLRLGAIGSFDSLNRHILRGTAPAYLHLIDAPLMQRSWDEPFTLYPAVAQAVALSDDRRHIAFRLDPNARFSDGTPVTPADVTFTFEALRDFGRPQTQRLYGLVERMELVDGSEGPEIHFHLSAEADREAALVLAMMDVLPAHVWADSDRAFDEPTLDSRPGAGPYRLVQVDPGRSITLERDAEWWGDDLMAYRGHHNPDRIEVRFFRDGGVLQEAFVAGEIDWLRSDDEDSFEALAGSEAARSGRIVMEALPHGRPDPVWGMIFNSRRAPFDDIRMRQALALTYDFDAINQALFGGAYQPITSIFPNSSLSAEAGAAGAEERAILAPNLAEDRQAILEQAPLRNRTGGGRDEQRTYLRQALQLFQEAGYARIDGQLVHQATGRPLTFTVLAPTTRFSAFVEPWFETLSRLGIQAQLRTVDAAIFRDARDRYDYDVLLWRWISTLSPGAEQRLYWGSDTRDQPGGRNYAGLADPAIDAAVTALTDSRTAEDLHAATAALDRAVMAQHGFVPLGFTGVDLIGRSARFAHPAPSPLYGVVLEAWYLNP